MRLLGLTIVVAACGGSADQDGAVLTVRAPDGPAAAARLELVLANADASTIADVDGQRARPGDTAEQSVRYYRQRETAGHVDAVAALDGFVVRIAPNPAANPDDQFIPFLIALDDAGAVTGIGAVRDEAGDPARIEIVPGKTERYVVDLVPIAEPPAGAPLASGEGRVVACSTNDGDELRSGLAWQVGDGAQLRLLLPDVSRDPGATDATARALDLDCDGAVASERDCDDLRPAFHAGAEEACDGLDTNCDGARHELVECPLEPGTCGPTPTDGLAVCLDRDGGQLGECRGDPQCLCDDGNPGPCTKCILGFQATQNANRQAPCTPATGILQLAACNPLAPCTVEVVALANSPWHGELAALETTSFGSKLTDVGGAFQLRVKLAGATEVPGTAASSVGEVFLAVTQRGETRQVGIDLQLSSAGPGDCVIGRDAEMTCSP